MKGKKTFISFMLVFVIIFGIEKTSNAMHIMEGYLPLRYCIAWGVITLPFLFVGIRNLNKVSSENKNAMIILAMAGAYAFVLSALKLPSVTGSSSHPTGTGLVSIFFGPTIGSVVALVVLLFQAILLAHGGLTTLGANTFSMGVVGPFVTYGLYTLGKKMKINKSVSIFIAAALGNLMTYVVTSIQLALAHPSEVGGVMASFTKFASIFAITQVPLAVVEGILTVIVVIGLESLAKPELNSLGYFKEA
ncbi:MAG: energy-coupling factor ABC transporter permease [Tissierellia bacterium]|jgi:cobalt/nickel transport system permease protein|nr:energy-coupling factor ABC transporter permease [Tissierellia bacterium]